MDNMQTMDMEYKPWGGLAGVYSGIQQAQTEQSNQNKLAMQGLEGTLKGIEAGRASADYSNPEMERLRQQGIMGKNMQDYSTGKLSYDTLDSNIKTKLVENLAKASDAEIDATINGLDMFNSIVRANGPAGIQIAAQKLNLPPQMLQAIGQLGDKAPEYAAQLSDLLKRSRVDSVKHRQTIDTENVKGGLDMAKTVLSNQGAMERVKEQEKGANARNAASINAQKEAANKITSLDQVIALNISIANDPTKTKVQRDAAAATIKQATQEKKVLVEAASRVKAEAELEFMNRMGLGGNNQTPSNPTSATNVINLD